MKWTRKNIQNFILLACHLKTLTLDASMEGNALERPKTKLAQLSVKRLGASEGGLGGLAPPW